MFHRENRIRQQCGGDPIREAQAEELASAARVRAGQDRASGRQPSTALIRSRAYAIYLARNGRPGDALSDWLRAEAELRRQSDGASVPTADSAHAAPPAHRNGAVRIDAARGGRANAGIDRTTA